HSDRLARASHVCSAASCISVFRRPPRPSPSATLFPYTTLFRSLIRVLGDEAHRSNRVCLVAELSGMAGLATLPAGDLRQRLPPQDRKSTRLNSSHVSISYAVFCLKKTTIAPKLHSGHSHCPRMP